MHGILDLKNVLLPIAKIRKSKNVNKACNICVLFFRKFVSYKFVRFLTAKKVL